MRVAGPPCHRTTPEPSRHRSYIGYGQAMVAGSAAKNALICASSTAGSTVSTVVMRTSP